ncbi:hypothetical protein ZOSMA_13G00900 [Zostera marina]|uniref:Uncharacterized protein n=1 Tax=Zostera marina TaxID=29655 RepID=A0A0K9PXZ4_ZOSMR|nr:hypothetical protein ZOSMA_13G00900 [Zostera marina]
MEQWWMMKNIRSSSLLWDHGGFWPLRRRLLRLPLPCQTFQAISVFSSTDLESLPQIFPTVASGRLGSESLSRSLEETQPPQPIPPLSRLRRQSRSRPSSNEESPPPPYPERPARNPCGKSREDRRKGGRERNDVEVVKRKRGGVIYNGTDGLG